LTFIDFLWRFKAPLLLKIAYLGLIFIVNVCFLICPFWRHCQLFDILSTDEKRLFDIKALNKHNLRVSKIHCRFGIGFDSIN